MLKKIFLISIFLLASCAGKNPYHQRENISSNPDFLVFEAKNDFDELYDSGATKSVKELYTPGSVMLNGSYFGLTDSGAYFPAGLWIEDGRKFSEMRTDDPNLSMVVSKCGTQWHIDSNDSWGKGLCKNGYTYAFQAGPLVLNKGWVASSFSGSWHADASHGRTMMRLTHDNRIYFFIFPKKVSLRMAGEAIMKSHQFERTDIDVVNLDGGPSTAYFDGNVGFNENSKFPIVIRIRS